MHQAEHRGDGEHQSTRHQGARCIPGIEVTGCDGQLVSRAALEPGVGDRLVLGAEPEQGLEGRRNAGGSEVQRWMQQRRAPVLAQPFSAAA